MKTLTERFADELAEMLRAIVRALMWALFLPLRLVDALLSPPHDAAAAMDDQADRVREQTRELLAANDDQAEPQWVAPRRPTTLAETLRRYLGGEYTVSMARMTMNQRVYASHLRMSDVDIGHLSDQEIEAHLIGTYEAPGLPPIREVHAELAKDAGIEMLPVRAM